MVELVTKEKIRIIGEILDLYFNTTVPDPRNKYWYGDMFDSLYDKDLLELRITLSVYKQTRKKKYV